MTTDISPRAAGIATLTVLLATCLAASSRIESARLGASAEVTVVYVGADNCAPCRTWREQRLLAFRASAEFARLTYREVTTPRLFDLLEDASWPDELGQYRSVFNRAAGVPLWVIAADGRILLAARGLGEWDDKALPRIRSLVR
jgi:hypothetical protein